MPEQASFDVQEALASTYDASSTKDEVMTLSLAPLAATRQGASLFGWVFGASLLAHAPAAMSLAASYQPTHQKHSQDVEIEFTPPPPPPPPDLPPPPEPPPPTEIAPKPQLEVPRVHLQAAPTSAVATAPVGDTPNIVATPGEFAMPEAPPAVAAVGPPAEPVAPPPPPPPAPIAEAKEGIHYRTNARPPYPHVAQREGWEGTVYLRVQVLPDGHVAGATVQRSAGHAALDEAALAVVKSWLFDPATQGGRGVLGVVTVPLQFKLE